MKNTVKKATALLMGVMMTLSSISFPVSVKADGNLTLSGSEETTVTETETAGYEYSYADYLYDDTKTDDLGDETVEITVDYEDLISLGEDASLVTANGRDHVISYTKDGGSAEFSVTVEKTGFYHIAAVYAQTEDTNRTISVGLMIDGEYPFTEAADMELPRVYEDNGEIRVDSDGNESAPKQIQVLDWQTESFHNTNGYYEGDYYFYFTEGTHTITLYGNEIVFLLDQIILYTEEETPSYAEYMEQTQGEDSSDVLVVIQAEKAKEKSASTLYISSRISPHREPIWFPKRESFWVFTDATRFRSLRRLCIFPSSEKLSQTSTERGCRILSLWNLPTLILTRMALSIR